MASPDPRHVQPGQGTADNRSYSPVLRRLPLNINTSHAAALSQQTAGNRRFSYIETPVEMQEPQFGIQPRRYRPEESPIKESPAVNMSGQTQQQQAQEPDEWTMLSQQVYVMPGQQRNSQQVQSASTQQQPAPTRQTSSPYTMSEPQQTHPTYSAPISQPGTATTLRSSPGSLLSQATPISSQQQFQPPQRTSTIPMRRESDENMKKSPLTPRLSQQPTALPQMRPDPTYIPHSQAGPITSPTQPIFSPTSLAGPNGAGPDLHQPGQAAHPNMTFARGESSSTKEEWEHGLCECSGDVGTCITGVICPCILDSRTAYRLERKSARKDPSDLLGFSNCNGRCGVMSLLGVCGLFCTSPSPPLPHKKITH
jgi:hypothetical protein